MWAVWEILREIFNLTVLDSVVYFADSIPDLSLDMLLVYFCGNLFLLWLFVPLEPAVEAVITTEGNLYILMV